MSNVLWLLYVADVAAALVPVLSISGLVLAFGLVIFTCIQADEAPRGTETDMFWKAIKVRLILPFVMILMACFMPSKQLLYIIVGLNVGAEVVQTDIGKKSLTALEAWLDKAIADAEGSK